MVGLMTAVRTLYGYAWARQPGQMLGALGGIQHTGVEDVQCHARTLPRVAQPLGDPSPAPRPTGRTFQAAGPSALSA